MMLWRLPKHEPPFLPTVKGLWGIGGFLQWESKGWLGEGIWEEAKSLSLGNTLVFSLHLAVGFFKVKKVELSLWGLSRG